MPEIKHFNSVFKLLHSKEFKSKDLSYCDLSKLDLSKLSWQTWKDFKFFHTNFSYTNIVFKSSALRMNAEAEYQLEYCDFTGCDLSYIDSVQNVSLKGSIFTGSKLDVKLYTHDSTLYDNTVFSEEMAAEVKKLASNYKISLATIVLNPHVPFNSEEIFGVTKRQIFRTSQFIPMSKYDICINLIKIALEEDKKREGELYRLFHLLGGDDLSVIGKIQFIKGEICNKSFSSLDLSSISCNLLDKFKFQNCQFEEIVLPEGIEELMIVDEKIGTRTPTIIPHIIIPNFDASSWSQLRKKRLGETCFTKQTNLYLELGRHCNANCPFCRNHCLKPCKLDFEAIVRNFEKIKRYLNNVVIGGGEPTLERSLLEQIIKKIPYDVTGIVSTNGSCGDEYLKYLLNTYTRINLSRHAIEDADNDRIFGIQTIDVEDIKRTLSNYYENYLTLVATCYKGELDSVEALERYIELSDYVHADSVLFQTLHEDLKDGHSTLEQIDTMVFDEVIAKLQEQGFIVSELPIYSTGDYKLIIVKDANNTKTISFKRYITKDELEKEWTRASKRTFDLSMAPNGTVYQNWHQSSEEIKSLNL